MKVKLTQVLNFIKNKAYVRKVKYLGDVQNLKRTFFSIQVHVQTFIKPFHKEFS